MADDATFPIATGTIVAADLIGGSLYQRTKLIHGADGTNDGDVSGANPLPVALRPGTATGATAAMAQAASATIKAANANRLGLIIYNPLDVDLLINLGAAAAATAAVARIGPRQSYVLPIIYTGAINGILAQTGGDGNVYVQELTA